MIFRRCYRKEDLSGRNKKEPVTILLILLNALIFLIVEITGGSENGQHMLECGAVYAPLIFEQGQWYRMFTSMFLHFGAPHLINNMLVLFVLGQRLEPVVGKIKIYSDLYSWRSWRKSALFVF